MPIAESNGITIEYHERGEGQPLLLVMGLGGQLIDWPQGFVDEVVAHGFRVISFDNRDSGLSTQIDGAPPTRPQLAKAVVMRRSMMSHYKLSDMAGDAIAVLDALGIDNAHIVGMSMGGMIAQEIAIEYPQRVRSLTSIMSTTGNLRVGRPKVRLIREAMRRKDPTLDNAIQLSLQTFTNVSGPTFNPEEFRVLAEKSITRSFRPDGTSRQLAAIIASPDRTASLARLRVPTLVIHGMLDPLVQPSGGIATARAIHGAKLVMYNDMAHDLPPTRWKEIADEIAAIAARAPQPVPRIVTAQELVHAVHAVVVDGRLRLAVDGHEADLHPIWLRNRSQEAGQVDATSRQRLFTPIDVPAELRVVECEVADAALLTSFSDGHTARLDLHDLEVAVGWRPDLELPPTPEPWTSPIERFPYVDWHAIGWSNDTADPDAVVDFLTAFYRYGYVVFRNTPAEDGTVRKICDRLGYISGNNFGWTFDVRAEPKPTDLAYTAIKLLAHTDQPYRQPVPGIQLLHCLRNEAPGGDSTLADGLAGAEALAVADPAAHAALVECETEFRYDMLSDTVVTYGRVLDYDRGGRFRQIRLNTKLDAPLPRPEYDLDAYYRGRRWLCEWLNDPAHQVTFRLEPGDAMFVDNYRVLHGRTEFDAAKGMRHLQGAYIDHDGPDTMYRLAVRRLAAEAGR